MKMKYLCLFFSTLWLMSCQDTSSSSEAMSKKKDQEDQCCAKESSTTKSESSEITCPECGFKKTEVLPTDQCLIKYTCHNCQAELMPKKGDCCVYCTYGTHKCPSKQDD